MGHKLAYCAINCIYFDEIYTGPKRGFTNPYTYLRAYIYAFCLDLKALTQECIWFSV